MGYPVLGLFELLEAVGRGGTAVVWRARHASGALAAVKVLLGDRDDDAFRAAFQREIRTVASLTHPGIVPVYDAGVVPGGLGHELVPGSPWLAMAWVDHTLSRWFRENPRRRRWPEVRRILLELLAALGHAHARGVTHLDVKPQNVLVDAAGAVRLSDFGIASSADDTTRMSSGAGTPQFMAPEQFLGDPGPASDLYAVGCLATWLVSGRPPFDGPPGALAQAHLYRAPERLEVPDGWPEALADWVAVLLSKLPHARYQRAADAAFALRSLGRAGAAAAPAPEVPAGPTDGGITWFPEEGPGVDAPAAPAPRIVVHPRPPVPDAWEEPVSGMHLAGAGLGLFGVRTVPLVDRVAERQALWEALHEVHAEGRPRLVRLVGPAGVGKTRLARALAVHAHEVGAAEVLAATHGPSGGEGHGLVPMVARWLGAGLPDDIVATLSEALRGAPVRQDERERAVLAVIEHVSRRRPVVLWLDDVQWGADARRLVARVLAEPWPVLVVVTVRVPADEALAELPPGRDLALGPLGPADSLALATSLLGLRGALAARVADASRGVPLFAVQLVGEWVERGLLVARGEGLAPKRGASITLPDDLHALWLERLEGLPETTVAALEVGAALGGLVSGREWTDACADAGLGAVDLEEAERRGLVRAGDEGWVFRHGLLCEALERRCRDRGRWAAVHRACAAALARDADRPTVQARRARHLVEAGLVEPAVHAALEASEGLSALGDFDAAARVLGHVSPVLGAVDADLRDRARVSLAGLELHRSRFHACEQACDALLTAADAPLRASSLLLRANARHFLGRLEASIADAQAAAALFADLGNAEKHGDALYLMALSANTQGRPDLALAHLDRAEAVWRAADGPDVWFAWLDWARADLALARQDYDEVRARASAAAERFEAGGSRWQAVLARGLVGEAWTREGDPEAARPWLVRARDEARALGMTGAPVLMTLGAWAHNEVLAGDLVAAEPVLRHVCEALRASGWHRSAPGLWVALAVCCASRGASDAAEQALAEAEAATVGQTTADAPSAHMAEHAARLFEALGDAGRAERCLVLAREHVRRLGR